MHWCGARAAHAAKSTKVICAYAYNLKTYPQVPYVPKFRDPKDMASEYSDELAETVDHLLRDMGCSLVTERCSLDLSSYIHSSPSSYFDSSRGGREIGLETSTPPVSFPGCVDSTSSVVSFPECVGSTSSVVSFPGCVGSTPLVSFPGCVGEDIPISSMHPDLVVKSSSDRPTPGELDIDVETLEFLDPMFPFPSELDSCLLPLLASPVIAQAISHSLKSPVKNTAVKITGRELHSPAADETWFPAVTAAQNVCSPAKSITRQLYTSPVRNSRGSDTGSRLGFYSPMKTHRHRDSIEKVHDRVTRMVD